MSDLIDRAEAQTAIQFAARRYTVAHEAHGEGRVVWSDDLISVADAMNALRKVPSAQPQSTMSQANDAAQSANDCISRQAAIAEFSCCELTPDGGIDANYAIDFLLNMPSAQPIDMQEAYYRGKIDGIKECTARLKKVNEEFKNEGSDQQAGGD